jgi:pyruvate formate lyase activating enzyme
MKIEIRGFTESSLIDWEGMIVSVLFTSGCNLRCPYCHNAGLVLRPADYEIVPQEKIIGFLKKRKDWVDGICLTGGEPCIFEDLPDFLRRIKKEAEVKVKLDTNGTEPEMLKLLIRQKLVDYVAMDIKAPLEDNKYNKAAGVKVSLYKIKESIKILMDAPVEYEFRTTVVPTLHTADDILAIAKYIAGARKLFLQNFNPKEEILDTKFKNIKPYPKEELRQMARSATPYVSCSTRGK